MNIALDYQQCNKCDTGWPILPEDQFCGFCGEALKQLAITFEGEVISDGRLIIYADELDEQSTCELTISDLRNASAKLTNVDFGDVKDKTLTNFSPLKIDDSTIQLSYCGSAVSEKFATPIVFEMGTTEESIDVYYDPLFAFNIGEDLSNDRRFVHSKDDASSFQINFLDNENRNESVEVKFRYLGNIGAEIEYAKLIPRITTTKQEVNIDYQAKFYPATNNITFRFSKSPYFNPENKEDLHFTLCVKFKYVPKIQEFNVVIAQKKGDELEFSPSIFEELVIVPGQVARKLLTIRNKSDFDISCRVDTSFDPNQYRWISIKDSNNQNVEKIELAANGEGETSEKSIYITFDAKGKYFNPNTDALNEELGLIFSSQYGSGYSKRYPIFIEKIKEIEPLKDYVAIDFGTTNTCCVVCDQNEIIEPLSFDSNGEMVTSVIYFTDISIPEKPVYLIGQQALEKFRMEANPAGLVRNIKSGLGTDELIVVFDVKHNRHAYSARQLYSLYMRALIDSITYHEKIGYCRPIKLNLTYPTVFGSLQKGEMQQEATALVQEFDDNHKVKLAVDEALACALQFITSSDIFADLLQDETDDTSLSESIKKHAIVYDFGGGTIDVVILYWELSYIPQTRQIRCEASPQGLCGLYDFGGQSITKALVGLMANKIEECYWDTFNTRITLLQKGISDLTLNERFEREMLNNEATLFNVCESIKISLCSDFQHNPQNELKHLIRFTQINAMNLYATQLDSNENPQLIKVQFTEYDSEYIDTTQTHEEENTELETENSKVTEPLTPSKLIVTKKTVSQSKDEKENLAFEITLDELDSRVDDKITTLVDRSVKLWNLKHEGEDPDYIILAGQGAKYPAFQQYIDGTFELDSSNIHFQPNAAKQKVVLGAAQYSKYNDVGAKYRLILNNKNILQVGIGVSEAGVFKRLFEHGDMLPIQRTYSFYSEELDECRIQLYYDIDILEYMSSAGKKKCGEINFAIDQIQVDKTHIATIEFELSENDSTGLTLNITSGDYREVLLIAPI